MAKTKPKAKQLDPTAPDLSRLLALKTAPIALADLAFLPENPMEHSQDSIEDMRDRLRARGQLLPLVVNRRHTPPQVVGGNRRMQAMLAEGWTHAAVVEVDMADEDAMALALELNALQDQSWHKDLLQKAMKRLDGMNLGERMDGVMSRLAEAQKLIPRMGAGEAAKEETPQLDRAAELQKKWHTAVGQTWQIGRHRVHCGDCMDVEAEDCEGVCTDPPYELKPELLQAAVGRWAKAAAILGTGKQVFQFCTNGWQHGIDFCWLHLSPRRGPAYGGGNAPLLYHVNVLVTQLRGHKHGWQRPAPDTSSKFEADYEDAHGHGHGKPVSLFEFMLLGFPWRTVCDPFAGTLPVLMACERLGKTFVGCELDPAMLAVGLERCADLSPQVLDS